MTKENRGEIIWLSEEQLAALVAPRTREVFDRLQNSGPMTVDELQQALSCPSKTLYYQVRKLMRVGLVSEAGSSRGTRRDRVLYQAVSAKIGMPSGYQGARYERLAARGVTALLRQTIRRFQQAAEQSDSEPELVDDMHVLSSKLRLSGEDVQEFRERLKALIGDFEGRQGAEGRLVTFVGVTTPHESRLSPSAEP